MFYLVVATELDHPCVHQIHHQQRDVVIIYHVIFCHASSPSFSSRSPLLYISLHQVIHQITFITNPSPHHHNTLPIITITFPILTTEFTIIASHHICYYDITFTTTTHSPPPPQNHASKSPLSHHYITFTTTISTVPSPVNHIHHHSTITPHSSPSPSHSAFFPEDRSFREHCPRVSHPCQRGPSDHMLA